jgi:hypothetical protein
MDEGSLQSLPDESFAHPRDRRAADLQGVGYSHVGPGFAGSIPSPSSAFKRMRAWVNYWRAGALPRAIKTSNLPRSSPVKLTGFFLFVGMGTPPYVRCRVATRTSGGSNHNTR